MTATNDKQTSQIKWYVQRDIVSGAQFIDSYWHPDCELLRITFDEPQWIRDARKDIAEQ